MVMHGHSLIINYDNSPQKCMCMQNLQIYSCNKSQHVPSMCLPFFNGVTPQPPVATLLRPISSH